MASPLYAERDDEELALQGVATAAAWTTTLEMMATDRLRTAEIFPNGRVTA